MVRVFPQQGNAVGNELAPTEQTRTGPYSDTNS